MFHPLLSLVILFSVITTLIAEPKAVITGPKEGKPGDLIVLSGVDSTGDGFQWIFPQNLQTLACSPLEIGFATATPGSYTFMLIAADKTAAISYTSHTVVIGTHTPTPGPVPDPGPGPSPIPDYLKNIELKSKQVTQQINDPTTAKAMADAIKGQCSHLDSLCSSGQCPTLQTAVDLMRSQIESVLRNRPRGSQAPWNLWREEMNILVQPKTVPEYVTMMRAAATGMY